MRQGQTLSKVRRLNRGRWALRLNKEGQSLNQIAKTWQVSDSTVRRWVDEALKTKEKGGD